MGAKFENDCIVANKLTVIGKILQNAHGAAQIEYCRVFACFGFHKTGERKITSSAKASDKACISCSLTNLCHFASPSGNVSIIARFLLSLLRSLSEWNVCPLCVLLPNCVPFTFRLLGRSSVRL